jgi:hypothetical protein
MSTSAHRFQRARTGAAEEGCLGCLGIVALLVIAAVLWFKEEGKKSEKRAEEYRRTIALREQKIAPRDIAMSEMRLSTSYGGSVTGRIANRSRDTLDNVEFKVTVYDCPTEVASISACTVVASPTVSAYETVPPGESRDFHKYVGLPSALQIRGTMRWTSDLLKVRATSP